jgi:hypothetical protein
MNKLKYYHLSLVFYFVIAGIGPTFLYDLKIFGQKALLILWTIPLMVLFGTPYALTVRKKAGIAKRKIDRFLGLYLISIFVKISILSLCFLILYMYNNYLIGLTEFFILCYIVLLNQDNESITDIFLLTKHYQLAALSVILKIGIYFASFYLLFAQVLQPTLFNLLITELVAVASVIIFYSIFSIYFSIGVRRNNFYFTSFVLKNYFIVSLKKRFVTTLSERLDLIVASTIVSEHGMGIIARAKTFTSVVRPVLKSFLIPANAEILSRILVKDNTYLETRNAEQNFNDIIGTYKTKVILNFSLIFSVILSSSVLFQGHIKAENEYIISMCIIMSSLIYKNVVRGYTSLMGSIKIKTESASFIYNRSRIDFFLTGVFASMAYFTNRFEFILISYIVNSAVFFAISRPKSLSLLAQIGVNESLTTIILLVIIATSPLLI